MTYHDDDDSENYEPPPTVRDTIDHIRFAMMPQRYTDESSDVNELLWQLTLEQRATRLWLITLCVLTLIGPSLAFVIIKILG